MSSNSYTQILVYNFTRNFVFILIIFLQRTNSFCPSKCICDHYLSVTCINTGLEEVPIQLNPNVRYVNVSLNQILNVKFTLTFYANLETLDLSKNRIDIIASDDFQSQYHLRTLNLSRNNIENLGKHSLRGLEQLKLLDISYNKISVIHATAMYDLKKLIELNLAHNKILSIEKHLFENMYSLEMLNFSYNQLLDIPIGNLDYLKKLKTLDLSGNLLEFIRNDSFQSLTELTTLSFVDNVINELDLRAFDGLSTLRTLDLSINNLTIVPTQQLSKLSNLSNLSMSGNFFKYIQPVALLNLFHLRELHLDRLVKLVKIDSRAFIDNTNLQIITIDNNPSLSDLPQKLFHGNPNLIEISLKGNVIRTLDAAQLPLDRLNRLYLADNPFVCNCSILWLWRLVNAPPPPPPLPIEDVPTKNEDALFVQQKSNQTKLIILELDKQDIGCNILNNQNIYVRHLLSKMDESDLTCPGHVITIISGVLSILIILITCISIFVYIKMVKHKKKFIDAERKNVNERIVPQQVDKYELERYLAATVVHQQAAINNEYKALRQQYPSTLQLQPPPPPATPPPLWELPIKEFIEEPDHYERFDNFRYDNKRSTKPHVVYV